MSNFIQVEQLDSKKAEEIEQAISDLSNSQMKDATLPLVLDNTKGEIKLAVELAKKIHASKVDVIIEAHGNLDAAGTILAAAGKKGMRHASFDTVFAPFEPNTKSVRRERLTSKNQSVLSALGNLEANRRRLNRIAINAEDVSAFEAKSLNLVDEIEKFQRKLTDTDSESKTIKAMKLEMEAKVTKSKKPSAKRKSSKTKKSSRR